jgi:putative ABC transport system substrate-binding protein
MQFDQKRRAFITLLGAAGAWPLAVRAQQPAMPVVGFLHSSSLEPNVNFVAAFRRGLSETGYTDGQNVTIEFRWAEGRDDRLPELAAEVIRRDVAIIATPLSTPAALAAKAATSTIPIVFTTGGDPVALGLVASLNRPGGNSTGISVMTVELTAKRLGLLHDLVPSARRFAALVNPNSPFIEAIRKDLQSAALTLGLQIETLYAGTSREIDAILTKFAQEPGGALLTTPDAFFYQPSCTTRHTGGALCAADDLSHTRIHRHRRADELWTELCGRISPSGHLYGTHSQRRETRRSASYAANHLFCD